MQKKIQKKKEADVPVLRNKQMAWHPPTLQRLQLSLDTAMGNGSASDAIRPANALP